MCPSVLNSNKFKKCTVKRNSHQFQIPTGQYESQAFIRFKDPIQAIDAPMVFNFYTLRQEESLVKFELDSSCFDNLPELLPILLELGAQYKKSDVLTKTIVNQILLPYGNVIDNIESAKQVTHSTEINCVFYDEFSQTEFILRFLYGENNGHKFQKIQFEVFDEFMFSIDQLVDFCIWLAAQNTIQLTEDFLIESLQYFGFELDLN